MEKITMENLPRKWEDVPAGTEISEDVFNDMLNCMPPVSLKNSPYCGFQMAEEHDYVDGVATRLTFINVGGKYYCAGIQKTGCCDYIPLIPEHLARAIAIARYLRREDLPPEIKMQLSALLDHLEEFLAEIHP